MLKRRVPGKQKNLLFDIQRKEFKMNETQLEAGVQFINIKDDTQYALSKFLNTAKIIVSKN